MTRPRPLTHDERKAAEAAFQGLPVNPAWTQGAKRVYLGIAAALHSYKDVEADQNPAESLLHPETAAV
jgi:hypothetical protein